MFARFLLSAALTLPGLLAAAPAAAPGAHLMFLAPQYNFGTIAPGAVVRHTFELRNTGTAPLVISTIGVSCGCTTPNWTKTPIAPGKVGLVTVTFNSAGKTGVQNKILTVESNSDTGPALLSLKGEVGATPKAARP